MKPGEILTGSANRSADAPSIHNAADVQNARRKKVETMHVLHSEDASSETRVTFLKLSGRLIAARKCVGVASFHEENAE